MLSFRPQSRGGDPDEDHQAGQTECNYTTSPRKERQGNDRGLEVGTHEDPPCL